MPGKRILIVEDERVVAEDLKRLLEKMGYTVTGVAAAGEEALEKVRSAKPDLVLMDIRIQGPLDGIEVAEQIYVTHDVPVSYLTAYADAPTLERAKATMPYGYILKPFDTQTLRSVIELAIHRHEMEAVLREFDGWHARALNSMSDAVIALNGRGLVVFMNHAAESLIGWTAHEFFGRPWDLLLSGGAEKASPLPSDAAQETTGPEKPAVLRTKNGASLSVKITRTLLPGKGGESDGVLLVLKKG